MGPLISAAPAGALVGRQAERARIAELLSAARRGASDALFVHAEAGVGKTALLDDAVHRADGLRVLRTAGYMGDADLPFAGLWDLLAPIAELRVELPVAARAQLSAARALGEPGGGVDSLAVRGAVHGLLALAAEREPLLVVVDDLQWLDDESRESILFAARELHDAGTALLLAARDGESTVVDPSGLAVLPLAGLAETDAQELLDRHWAGLAPAVAARLVQGTHGNPLALLEIPSSLTTAQRSGTAVASMPSAVPLGRQLQEAFRSQLDALPDDVARAAGVAAALGGQTAQLLDRALDQLGIPARALADAQAADLLTIQGDHVVFRHPLLAAAAYQDRPSSERRAAHETFASLCSADPVRQAWHRSAAAEGPDESVAAALTAAGELARSRGAHVSAAAAFVRAAELSTDDQGRARRELDAARSHAVAGRTVAALELIAGARRRKPDPATRSALVRLQAHVELRDGSPRTAEQLLEDESADLLAAGDEAGAALCLLESGLTHMVSGHMGALQTAAHRAAQLAPPAAGELRLMAGLIEGEALLAMGQTAQGLELLDAAQPIIDGVDPSSEVADAVTMAAQAVQWVDDYPRAAAILDRMASGARRAGAAGRLAYPLAVRAMLEWRRGRIHEALAAADEALRLAELSKQATIATLACAALARIAALRGEADVARGHVDRGLAIAAGGGGDAVLLHALAARGFAELSDGQPARAADVLDEADNRSRRLAHGEPTLMLYAADHVEALVRCGRIVDARAALDRLAASAQSTRSAWTKAVVHRGELLLCADADVDRHGLQALRWHDGIDMPFERARSELVLGERLRRDRRRGEARAPLETAREMFERLGAQPWATRARDELRASGVATEGSMRRPGVDDLSSRELQVAELAADGLTNREVASTLFLSARTVEHHLTSIYRKLDVTSRTQLAQRLVRGA